MRTYRVPVMIGNFVRTVEMTIIPGLGLTNDIDTRRVIIVDPQDWRSIELSIQTVETLATWWLNHGPIPKEQIKSNTKKEESKVSDREGPVSH